MVLVTQPTHPAFWKYDEERHHKCQVCNATFQTPPPTRHELMQSFTGPELASLIDLGGIIGAHEVFSQELARQVETLSDFARETSSYDHWVQGCYLITGVEPEDGKVTVTLSSPMELLVLKERLDANLSLVMGGKRLRIVAEKSLEGVLPGHASPPCLPHSTTRGSQRLAVQGILPRRSKA